MNSFWLENGARALELRAVGKTNREIATEFNQTYEAVRCFFRRSGSKRRTPKREEEEELPPWCKKGAVFADPLLSALWRTHPEYRPRKLIERFLPACLGLPTFVKPEPQPRPPDIGPLRRILTELAVANNVTVADLTGEYRGGNVALIRQEFYYRAAKETTKSYPDIGRFCGGRNHATVLHGIIAHCVKHGLAHPRLPMTDVVDHLERKKAASRRKYTKVRQELAQGGGP